MSNITQFIIGFLVGYCLEMWLASLSHSRQIREHRHTHAANVSAGVSALQALRAGKVAEAIQSLEVGLGCDVFMLCIGVDSIRKIERDAEVAEALQAARDYHAQHPLKTEEPDLDKEIARVLAKVS